MNRTPRQASEQEQKSKNITEQKIISHHFQKPRPVIGNNYPLNILIRSSNSNNGQNRDDSTDKYKISLKDQQSSDSKTNNNGSASATSSQKRRVFIESPNKYNVPLQSKYSFKTESTGRSYLPNSDQKTLLNTSGSPNNLLMFIDSEKKKEQERQSYLKHSNQEDQQVQSEQSMLKTKYKSFLQNSQIFKNPQLKNLKLSEKSKNLFEMNDLETKEKINSESEIKQYAASLDEFSSNEFKLEPPRDHLTNGLAMLSLSPQQKRLKASLMNLAQQFFDQKEFQTEVIEKINAEQENKQIQEKKQVKKLSLPCNSARIESEMSKFIKVSAFKQSVLKFKALPKNTFQDSFDQIGMRAQNNASLGSFQNDSVQDHKDQNKMNVVDFCLYQIMEKLESKVIGEFQRDSVKFNKKCFEKVLEIVNEHMPSIILRVGEEDQSNLHSFLRYISNFLSWFLTSAAEHFDSEVDKRVKETCEEFFGNVSELKEQIRKNEEKIREQLEEIHSYQRELFGLKSAHFEERNKLISEMNALQERIDEFNNKDFYQDSSHKLTLKIIDLQQLMSNLQNQSFNSGQILGDNLCSLGESVMPKTKDLQQFEEDIQKEVNMAKVKDEHFYHILKDHPFFAAFFYTKIMQECFVVQISIEFPFYYQRHQNQVDKLTPELDLQKKDYKKRLLEFLFNLRECHLDENNCAEAYMEYILKQCTSQFEGFSEVTASILEIINQRKEHWCNFFQHLFGVGGCSFPSHQAVKEVLSLLEDFRKVYGNLIEGEEEIICDREMDKRVSQIIQNQNALLGFKQKFVYSTKKAQPFEILSYFLTSITFKGEQEKMEDLYNLFEVSTSENLISFEDKLSYTRIKELAIQLKMKPFTFFNYVIQTYEKYSRHFKKVKQNTSSSSHPNNSHASSVSWLDTRTLIKVLQDCYLIANRFSQISNSYNISITSSAQRPVSPYIQIDNLVEETNKTENNSPRKDFSARKLFKKISNVLKIGERRNQKAMTQQSQQQQQQQK